MPYNNTREPIAVVGSGCHFAGNVDSVSGLWELLRQPRDVRSVIPDDCFSPEGWYHPNGSYHGHCNVKQSYLISRDVRKFDAQFFNTSPLEARSLDPQQSFLLETVYEAVEAAGLTVEGLRGSDTGVYVGVMSGDIEASLLRDTQNVPVYMTTGTSRSIVSNRISYFFGWQGPSITVDTACSSSLVAVHMAVQALRAGDCQVTVACGTNLLLGPEQYIAMSKLKMLSPDSLSRMWDRDANGYARGDGISVIVLKTLSKALADGDDIECIIRETGVNQDGSTSSGLAQPSSSAQKELIRSVYRKAGLDLLKGSDQPQYFEAHGTGTPIGDPIEAAGMYGAFSPDDTSKLLPGRDPMYVGSVKTVIGHTEGSAGIAGILKTSLALQHACIPPNLHFDNLSESVAPFYRSFEISKTTKPWPKIEGGGPRRASVNSFGIGGTNAHAILESWNQMTNGTSVNGDHNEPVLFSPIVFSAGSQTSLRKILLAYETLLNTNPTLNLQDLAFTLRERRSVFRHRAAFPASSIEQLKSRISEKLSRESEVGTYVSAPPSGEKDGPGILGIFTGQGAQHARMGAELIEKSATARQIIQQLDAYLAQLPPSDCPSWSMETELLAESSRVGESAISQPVCTAIQILLTDLLKAAGISFSAVVGHSSGEIGAAYAAGYITARDAIYIAYYRGLHLESARSPRGDDVKGAMLAAGISMEETSALCAEAAFEGLVCVAASNSSSSVTISGDEDAILEVQKRLESRQTMNRRLRVDRAYHSPHVVPCLDGYVKSLMDCDIKPLQAPAHRCTWYSSVSGLPIGDEKQAGLEGPYWAANLRESVLFSHAVKSAVTAQQFDLALEVGAHPALQGPARQNISETLAKDIPYHGTLARKVDAVEAFADALSFLWTHMSAPFVNLDNFEKSMAPATKHHKFRVLKGLPAYQWNHDMTHWSESRISRRMRLRKRVHPLLGDMCVDTGPHQLVWRHLLRETEIDWLPDHKVQGQTIFPAAGYISTIIEASQVLIDSAEVQLVEMRDFYIHQAVSFDLNNDNGVEVLISLTDISKTRPGHVRAKFTYSAALGASADELTLAASADIDITIGDPSPDLLPKRAPIPPHMVDVKPEVYYQNMDSLGYQFRGRFASLHSITRRHTGSSCLVKIRPQEDDEANFGKPLTIHPGELDSALQSIFLARGYPGDEQLSCLHLPQSCSLIRVNVLLARQMTNKDALIPVDSNVDVQISEAQGFSADIDIYSDVGDNAAVQFQDIILKPLQQISEEDDKKVFYETHWVRSGPDGLSAASGDAVVGEHHSEILPTLVRIANFYLRRLLQSDHDHVSASSASPHLKYYLDYARQVISYSDRGQNRWMRKEWLDDTLDDVIQAGKTLPSIPDVPMMHIVGQGMPRALKGEVDILEELRTSGLFDEYYARGFGLSECTQWVGRIMSQIADRYPHMKIIEIGAGTGAATKSILAEVGSNFLSYTSTDLSVGFAETQDAIFSKHRRDHPHRRAMTFSVLDAEKDPIEQGYEEGGYDLLVAFGIIHATVNLETTLRNIRKILKPGGFLVVVEPNEEIQPGGIPGFIFGSLPGWWLGVDEGRVISPLVSAARWDELLKATGFSGIDEAAPKDFETALGFSNFVSQAVDDRVQHLRAPLATLPLEAPISDFFIIGGISDHTTSLAEELRQISESFAVKTNMYKTLGEVDHSLVHPSSVVVSLTDLDKPVFQDITEDGFQILKPMFTTPKTMLWLTTGRRGKEPYSNMTVGFGRSAVNETAGLCLQFLDVDTPASLTARQVSEFVLRLLTTSSPEGRNGKTLWSFEPEIVIDEQGRELLPRIRHVSTLNDRYNSTRREITREIDHRSDPILLQRDGTKWIAKQLSLLRDSTAGEKVRVIDINTTHTITSAIRTRWGYGFLALGIEPVSQTKYLALVPSPASVLRIPSSSAVICPDTQLSDGALLALVAAQLVASTILDSLWGGSQEEVVVHNAPTAIAEAIAIKASSMNIKVVFMTDSHEERQDAPDSSWVTLRPYISRSALKKILPSTVSCFVGLTQRAAAEAGHSWANHSTALSCLPPHCRRETLNMLFSLHGSESIASNSASLADFLQHALDDSIRLEERERAAATSVVSVADLTGQENLINDPLTVADWTISNRISVLITRLDSESVLFKADKTYWIIGLVSKLGTSLCDWMVKKGARTIVLTSRNPKIDENWITTHAHNGATIAIMPGDITDETSLRAVKQTITTTLPPIAGVMNGAVILEDVSISNMTFPELLAVLGPKSQGSTNLDRLFASADTDPLDFFLLFSSVTSVYGNPGQANYVAANMYMCALAARRRQRGLAGTAVDLGSIFGVGYMERGQGRAVNLTISKMYFMHLSEADFHQIIAEAIHREREGTEGRAVLSTGLRPVEAGVADPPVWADNPRFAAFLMHETKGEDGRMGKEGGVVANGASISDMFQRCVTQREVEDVVKGALAARLRRALQLTTADDDHLMSMRSKEVGIDSLVAVDIRSWCLKTFEVAVPVLKIMGNDTLAGLAEHVSKSVPTSLVPNVKK